MSGKYPTMPRIQPYGGGEGASFSNNGQSWPRMPGMQRMPGMPTGPQEYTYGYQNFLKRQEEQNKKFQRQQEQMRKEREKARQNFLDRNMPKLNMHDRMMQPLLRYQHSVEMKKKREQRAIVGAEKGGWYKPVPNELTDPYKINSLSDVLFNSTAKNAKYGTPEVPLLGWLHQTGKAAGDYYKTSYAKPINDKQFKKVISNSMVALGEDYALFRNPMKGVIVEADSRRISGKVGLATGIVAGGAKIAAGVAAAGAASPQGALAVLGIKGVAALLGGALATGAAAGGAAAVGTAAVQDPKAAMRGLKRGFGVGGEEKQMYDLRKPDGDRYGMFSNIMINIALDPVSWVGEAGNIMAQRTSQAMHGLMNRQTLQGKDYMDIKDMWSIANTSYDKVYAATESVKAIDKMMTKGFFYANPLGMTWTFTKGTGKLVKEAYQSVVASTVIKNKYDYASAFDIDNAEKTQRFMYHMQSDKFTKDRVRNAASAAQRQGEHIVRDGKLYTPDEYLKAFGEKAAVDYGVYADNLPDDMTALRQFIRERRLDYIQEGHSGDRLLALVQNDLEILVKARDVDATMYSELSKMALETVKGIDPDTPDEVLDILISDLLMDSHTEAIVDSAMDVASTKFYDTLVRDLGATSSKLEVMARVEEEFIKVLNLEEGTDIATALLSIQMRGEGVADIYVPILESAEAVLKMYGVSERDLMAYVAKHTGALNELSEQTVRHGLAKSFLDEPLTSVKDEVVAYSTNVEITENLKRGLTVFDKSKAALTHSFLEEQIKQVSDYKMHTDFSFWERPDYHSPMVIPDTDVSYENVAGERYNPLYDTFLKITQEEEAARALKKEEIENFKYEARKGGPVMVFGDLPKSKEFKSFMDLSPKMVAINELAEQNKRSVWEELRSATFYKNLDVRDVVFILDDRFMNRRTFSAMEDAMENKKHVHIFHGGKFHSEVKKDSEIFENIRRKFSDNHNKRRVAFIERMQQAENVFKHSELDVYDLDETVLASIDTLAELWGLDKPNSSYDYQLTLNTINEYVKSGIPTNEILVGDVFEADHEGNIMGRELLRSLEGLPEDVVEIIKPLLNIKEYSVTSYGNEEYLEDTFHEEGVKATVEGKMKAIAQESSRSDVEEFLNTMTKVRLVSKDSKALAGQILPEDTESDLEAVRQFMKDAVKDESLILREAQDAFGGTVTNYDVVVEQAYMDVLKNVSYGYSKTIRDRTAEFRDAYDSLKEVYPLVPVLDKALNEAERSFYKLEKDIESVRYLNKMGDYMTLKTGVGQKNTTGLYSHKNQVDAVKELIKSGELSHLHQQDLDFLFQYERRIKTTELDTNALTEFGTGYLAYEESYNEILNSIPQDIRDYPGIKEKLADMERALGGLKRATGKNYEEAIMPMTESLPKGKFYKLQMNKRYQIEHLAQVGFENHKDLLNDLFVEHGEVREMFDTIKELTLDDTGYGYLQNAAWQIEQELWGLKSYADLTVSINDIVTQKGLDAGVHDAVKEAIVEFGNVELGAVTSDLLKTNGDLDRLVENNLAMMGYDPALKDDFMPIIVEYAREMEKVAADTFIKIPGAHSNHMVNLLLSDLKEDFFPNAEAYDRALSAAYDLELMKEDILQAVFDLAELQKAANKNVLINENGVNIRRALMSSKFLGAKDLSLAKRPKGDSYERITPPDKMKTRLIKEVVRDTGNLADLGLVPQLDADLEDLELAFSKLDAYLNLELRDVHINPKEALEAAREEFGEEAVAKVERGLQKNLYLQAETNLPLYKEIFNFVESMKDYDEADPLFSKLGYEATQQMQAELVMDMPSSDIARELKYNTPTGTFFIEAKLMPFGIEEDKANELFTEFGVLFHKVEGAPFYAISKVKDSPKWDALDEPSVLYSGSNEFSLAESEHFDALLSLDNYMRDRIGVKTVFATDAKIPTRYNPNQMMNMFTRFPGMVEAAGGWEQAEKIVGSLARSRGYDTLFIASHDFQQNLVGRDAKTGTSYLAYDSARGYFNAAMDLIDHNAGSARMESILRNADTSLTVNRILETGVDEEDLLHALQANRDAVPIYVNPKTGRIREFKIKNKRDLRRANKMGLAIVHRNTYDDLDRYLNDHKLQSWGMFGKAIRTLEKAQAPFKGLVMTAFGPIARNAFDSGVKHFIYEGNAGKVVTEFHRAAHMLKEAEEIAKGVKGDFDNTRKVEKYLRSVSKSDEEFEEKKKIYNRMAFLYDSYAVFNQMDVVNDRAIRGLDADGNPIKAKLGDNGLIRDLSYNNPVTSFFLKGYSDVEMISRTAIFNSAMDKHGDAVGAIGDVTGVHGDYSARSEAERILNAFMPFSGFPIRNLLYWMENAFHYPIILRAFYNEMVDSWVQDEYSAKQIASPEEGFADWMMQRGAHQQKTDRMSKVFKHNPSFFSALTTVPEYVFDPGAKLTPVIKNLETAADHFMSQQGPDDPSLYDKLEKPWDPALHRVSSVLTKGVPGLMPMLTGEGQLGKRESWMFGGLVPSLYAVNKFSPKEWEYKYDKFFTPRMWPNTGQFYGPGTMGPYNKFTGAQIGDDFVKYGAGRGGGRGSYSGGRSSSGSGYSRGSYGKNYGRYPNRSEVKRNYVPQQARFPALPTGASQKYYAMGKGNRALSTGFVTKKGQFKAGLGLVHGGNPMYMRDRSMQVGFGVYGAYLQNAPHGVQLQRLDYYTRTLYGKLYTNAGRPRMASRTKPISDPRSLMYRLQDMRYNIFSP